MKSRASALRGILDRLGQSASWPDNVRIPGENNPQITKNGQIFHLTEPFPGAWQLTDEACRVTTADASQPPFNPPQAVVTDRTKRDSEDHTVVITTDLSPARQAFDPIPGEDPKQRFERIVEAFAAGHLDIEVEPRQYDALIRAIWRG